MELRKLLPALPLTVLLALGACTAAPENAADSSGQPELVLAGDADPMYRALAGVYARELEADGFQVTVLDPAADPVDQVRDGQADLAVTAASSFLAARVAADDADDADDAENTDDDGNPATALTREEVTRLATSGQDEEFSGIEISPGDLGQLLVMSRADIALNKIEDVSDLLAQCQDLSFAAAPEAAPQLREALDAADCPPEAVTGSGEQDPAELLREADAQAVALSRNRAMIADEGFIAVPSSAGLFNSEPVLAFGTTDLDPAAQGILATVTAALTDDTLRAVNRMVQGPEPASVDDVARHWQWLIQ